MTAFVVGRSTLRPYNSCSMHRIFGLTPLTPVLRLSSAGAYKKKARIRGDVRFLWIMRE